MTAYSTQLGCFWGVGAPLTSSTFFARRKGVAQKVLFIDAIMSNVRAEYGRRMSSRHTSTRFLGSPVQVVELWERVHYALLLTNPCT